MTDSIDNETEKKDNKHIIFCLPAQKISPQWFHCWNETVRLLQSNNITFGYSMNYDPVIHFCRNKILGADTLRGIKQKPWDNKVAYDYQIWIDSDIVWNPDDILKLINHDKDIVTGCYLMSDNKHFALVENCNYDDLLSNGSFKFLDRETFAEKKDLFKINYTGLGFVCIKNGVIESLDYPWFHSRLVKTEDISEFTSEDVGFCWSLLEKGYEIYADPSIVTGHLKETILIP